MNAEPEKTKKTAKRRILCVTSNFPRWAGDSTTPFVLHLAQDLQEYGWTVDVLAPHAPGAAKKEELGGVSVKRFRYFWPEASENICYQGGALVNLRKSKVTALKLPFLIVAEWLAVCRLLLSRNYDAAHFHWILPQGFVGAVSAKLLGIPYVVTVHGGDVFALRGRILLQFKRIAISAANTVTANSSATEKAVLKIHGAPKELRRIPMGVSVRDVAKQSKEVRAIRGQYRRGKGPLLVFVGRLVEEKGCADFIEAVSILKSELPEVSAIIIGEGQDREAMEGLATQLGLANRICFTGWVQPDKVLEHLAAADIFIGPSRTSADGWVEAQGLTFIEAMVARTPVIATRVGGIVDSVVDGQTGLLVDERSPSQIAAAVLRILRNDELRANIVEAGLAQAVDRFSRSASATAFASLFSHLIAKQGGYEDERR